MSGAACLCGRRLSRLGRAIGHLVGGLDYEDRLRTATFAREALERSEELKRDWNRQVERAAEEGVHVIYTDGYDHLHKELDTIAKRHAPGSRRQIGDKRRACSDRQGSVKPQLLRQLAASYMAGQMDRREALAAKAAERGVAVPDHEDYDTWRNVTDFAVGRCEGLMDDPGRLRHPPRLHRAPRKRASAQRSRGCAKCLKNDDRRLAATLAGQREGERHPDARGARRPSARRSGEAPGVAATARGAQGRQAAEQGPVLEHANLVRAGRAGDEIAIASFIGRRESPTRQDQGASGVYEQDSEWSPTGGCALHTVICGNSRSRNGLKPSRRLSETTEPQT